MRHTTLKCPPKRSARVFRGMTGFIGAFTDAETREQIGHIELNYSGWDGSNRKRSVSLFGGKYYAEFDSYDECCAFAEGVVAVINQVAAPRVEKSESSAA